jgi:hypothetical protein
MPQPGGTRRAAAARAAAGQPAPASARRAITLALFTGASIA